MTENWNEPPQHLLPGTWCSTPSLATVTARALSRCGIYADNDPYVDNWAEWVNAAREDLLAALTPICGGATMSEIAIAVNADGLYDLTGYGVLRIDRVGIGTGTGITWLPWAASERAFMETLIEPSATTAWAGTWAYRAGGSVIGLAPIPVDTTVQIIVQGGMFPRPLILTTDSTGIPLNLLNLLVVRTAWYCCDFDRADAQREKRIPGLERDWDRGLFDARLRYLQSTPRDAGMATVYGVTETDTMSGSRRDTGVSLVATTIIIPAPVLRLKSVTMASTAGTTPLVFTCVAGYPVDADSIAAVMVFSADQGYMADVVVSGDRLTITATPQAGQQWYGEDVTAIYGSTGT